jgi:hypothetical protein
MFFFCPCASHYGINLAQTCLILKQPVKTASLKSQQKPTASVTLYCVHQLALQYPQAEWHPWISSAFKTMELLEIISLLHLKALDISADKFQ